MGRLFPVSWTLNLRFFERLWNVKEDLGSRTRHLVLVVLVELPIIICIGFMHIFSNSVNSLGKCHVHTLGWIQIHLLNYVIAHVLFSIFSPPRPPCPLPIINWHCLTSFGRFYSVSVENSKFIFRLCRIFVNSNLYCHPLKPPETPWSPLRFQLIVCIISFCSDSPSPRLWFNETSECRRHNIVIILNVTVIYCINVKLNSPFYSHIWTSFLPPATA